MTDLTIDDIESELSRLQERIRELEADRERLRTRAMATAAPARAIDMAEVLRSRGVGASSSHVFVSPNIPPRKLSGALESHGLRPEDVVMVIDDTVMGGAKDGVVLTRSHLLLKAMFEPPARFALNDIRMLSSEKNRVFVNGREALKLSMPDKNEVARAFDAIWQGLEMQRTAGGAGGAPSPPLPPTLAPTTTVRDRQGPSDYAGEDPRERAFLALDRGFYANLARAVEADHAAGRFRSLSVDARDYNRLVAAVLSITGMLPQTLERQGIVLTRADVATLMADVVRFEVFIYVSTLIVLLLRTESGFDEDQSSEFVAQLCIDLMLGYAVEVERLGEARTLKNVSNPMAALKASELMDMYRRRSQVYMNEMLQRNPNLPASFASYVRGSCALDADPRKTVDAWAWYYETIERLLTKDVAFGVLREISARTETALIDFFNQD